MAYMKPEMCQDSFQAWVYNDLCVWNSLLHTCHKTHLVMKIHDLVKLIIWHWQSGSTSYKLMLAQNRPGLSEILFYQRDIVSFVYKCIFKLFDIISEYCINGSSKFATSFENELREQRSICAITKFHLNQV